MTRRRLELLVRPKNVSTIAAVHHAVQALRHSSHRRCHLRTDIPQRVLEPGPCLVEGLAGGLNVELADREKLSRRRQCLRGHSGVPEQFEHSLHLGPVKHAVPLLDITGARRLRIHHPAVALRHGGLGVELQRHRAVGRRSSLLKRPSLIGQVPQLHRQFIHPTIGAVPVQGLRGIPHGHVVGPIGILQSVQKRSHCPRRVVTQQGWLCCQPLGSHRLPQLVGVKGDIEDIPQVPGLLREDTGHHGVPLGSIESGEDVIVCLQPSSGQQVGLQEVTRVVGQHCRGEQHRASNQTKSDVAVGPGGDDGGQGRGVALGQLQDSQRHNHHHPRHHPVHHPAVHRPQAVHPVVAPPEVPGPPLDHLVHVVDPLEGVAHAAGHGGGRAVQDVQGDVEHGAKGCLGLAELGHTGIQRHKILLLRQN
mmetsp:Transcript_35956/g.86583  ORF Transcript_35956/g.86583 Transcript_35956/m.86583 type:complete len:420 (+) Transcript_35956:308-1567(+)